MPASLESRAYVATPADIATLARQIVRATEAHEAARSTYLRALVATTRARLLESFDAKADAPTVHQQLRVLGLVHCEFWTALLEVVVTPDIAPVPRLGRAEKRSRGLERKRRTAFARSAKATLVAWIKAGHDIRTLKNPAKVTKSGLRAECPRTKRSRVTALPVLQRRTNKAAERVIHFAKQMQSLDTAESREALQDVTHRLLAVLSQGTHAVTEPEEAQGVPLRIGRSLFWPMAPVGSRREPAAAH